MGPRSPTTSCSTWARSSLLRLRLTNPASILEMSRKSFSSAVISVILRTTLPRNSFWVSLISPVLPEAISAT